MLEKRIQCFPVDPSKMNKTTGAATIDASGMDIIIFDAAVTVYFDGVSSYTYDWSAEHPKVITNVTSIHVDKAVNYMWVGTATR